MSTAWPLQDDALGPPAWHRAGVVWLTGLSGSGKTTLGQALAEHLEAMGQRVLMLDGDHLRQGLCSDLGFGAEDRRENIRRAGEVARLAQAAGVWSVACLISPFAAERQRVRERIPAGCFIEVHCCAPLEVCESRDVKGLYRRARQGLIPHFTGISSPYDPPEAPELATHSGRETLPQSLSRLLQTLSLMGLLPECVLND